MKKTFKVTADGSHTLYIEEMGEHYHSYHGAIQESEYVFIGKGLREFDSKEKIKVLEMGFGTGLNVLLTMIHKPEKQKIDYISLEKYPLSDELIAGLNYAEQLKNKDSALLFKAIHDCPWESFQTLDPNFRLLKHEMALQDFQPEENFDLIYYDAFGPRAQPDLWTEEIFRNLAGWMNEGAVLVTYCAKGDVRRAMISAGLKVEKLPGPPGKREMLRARK